MRYFLTVDWCNKGRRGVFCNKKGAAFFREDREFTQDEIGNILGLFRIILYPKSRTLTEKELKEFNEFIPLAEYSNEFGIAVKEEEN